MNTPIASIRDTLIIVANNPASHGGLKGLQQIMLAQAERLRALASPAGEGRLPPLPQLTGAVAKHESGHVLFTGLQVQEYARAYGQLCLATTEQPGSAVQGEAEGFISAGGLKILRDPNWGGAEIKRTQHDEFQIPVYTTPPPAPAAEQGVIEVQDKWSADIVEILAGYGFAPEAAAVFASAEIAEYHAGLCECAELAPVDMVDLLMDTARSAVETWKAESVGRPFGYKPAATQPEARGVEGMVLVPRTPTTAMMDAGMEASPLHPLVGTGKRIGISTGEAGEIYKAMLAATPNPVRAEQSEPSIHEIGCSLTGVPNRIASCTCGLADLGAEQPEGKGAMKLVPVEPTREMQTAGKHALKGAADSPEWQQSLSVYGAMLASAPAALGAAVGVGAIERLAQGDYSLEFFGPGNHGGKLPWLVAIRDNRTDNADEYEGQTVIEAFTAALAGKDGA